MKFAEFTEAIRNFEEHFLVWRICIFRAIEKLEDVRVDISRVDAKEHLEKIGG